MANMTRLKARGRTGKPTWRIQFYDGAGDRRAIYLGAVPKKAADVWLNRVEQLNACIIAGVALDTDLAVWVGSLQDASHDRLVQVGLAEPRDSSKREAITVARLTVAFVERSAGKPATIRGFQQTLNSLVVFFGPDAKIESITAEGADAWRVWVANDKQGSGRRKKRRTTEDNRLAAPTVAKRVSVAKQVFRCAVRWEWLKKSPFEALRPGSQANPTRAHYVPLETIRDVLDACPSVEWKLVIGLARFSGLRCPTEIGELRWGDVNWAKGRLTVRAKKTEHHGADHAVRVVPICPELRGVLADAFEQAEPGATSIVPMASRPGVNLRTYLERIISKAGHTLWPRLLQNLRASCATDWVEKYPSHVVAKWLGHSPKVAAQHYLMSRDHHFEDVVGTDDSRPEVGANGGQGSPTECDVNCASIATRNATPQASASGSTEPHETTEPADTTRVTAGSSEIAPVTKTGRMAGTGFEPVTSRL